MQLDLEISRAVISESRREDERCCPIAKAYRAETGRLAYLDDGVLHAKTGSGPHAWAKFDLDPELGDWVDAYDKGLEVPEIEIRLESRVRVKEL